MRVVFEFWVGVFEAEIESKGLKSQWNQGNQPTQSLASLLALVLALCRLETPKGAHPAGLGCKPNWAEGPAFPGSQAGIEPTTAKVAS